MFQDPRSAVHSHRTVTTQGSWPDFENSVSISNVVAQFNRMHSIVRIRRSSLDAVLLMARMNSARGAKGYCPPSFTLGHTTRHWASASAMLQQRPLS